MLPRPLRPLRSRSFALVWSSALVSNVGSWMQAVALGWLVTAETRNPLWTGLVAAADFVPIGLLSPIGGLLADTWDRRRWLMGTTVLQTVLAGVLALVAAHRAAPVVLVVLAFCCGSASASGFPAYQAMLPDLVPAEDLLAAVSLSSAQFNAGRVVGPALAGVVVVGWGAVGAFWINATSFLAVVAALAFVRLPARVAGGAVAGVGERLREGIRATAAEPACRSAVLTIAGVALVASPFIALVPAVAVTGLHAGATGTAALVTGQGFGAVVGALLLPAVVARLGLRRALTGSLVGVAGTLVAYGLAPTLRWAVVAIVALGFCYIGILSSCNTAVQLRAPGPIRGRVLGIYMMALGTCYPLGALLQGAVAHAEGVRRVEVAAGAALAVVVAVAALAVPGILRAFSGVDVARRAPAAPAVSGAEGGLPPL